MNNPLHKLEAEAKLLKLSAEEKSALHAALMQKVKEGENAGDASAPRLTPSPFFFAPQFAGAFAALLLIVAGAGTAYAAKGALPGDLLYSVKTNVNEPIEGALAFSTESKIEYQNGLAQNRLEEAEALASQDRLDSTTTQELESSIDTHLSQRDALAQSLDASDPGSSAAVVGELDSAIAAHGDVLAALGAESESTTTRDNTDALASRARLAASGRGSAGGVMAMAAAKAAAPMIPAGEAPHPALMMAPMDASATEATGSGSTTVGVSIESGPLPHAAMAKAEATGSADEAAPTSTQTQNEKSAKALEDRATTSLEALEQSAGAASKNVKADVAAKLNARLAKISGLVAGGQAALAAGDFDTAKGDFSQALDRSATLSTFISANARFDSGILGHLLDNSSDDDGGE